MSDRERAQVRCCLQSLSAFEHHGVELRQHAQTCSLPGCLGTGQSSAGKDPAAACPSPSPRRLPLVVPSCAVLRACLVLTHRPCLVHFLAPSQDGRTAFHYAAYNGHVAAMEFLLAHGADPNAKGPVRAPLEAYWLKKKGREEGRVQRCTRACHERCTDTHEPPAQALRSPRRTQSHET